MVELIRDQWCIDLEDLLNCPICMTVPKTKIFQCEQGHHICQECKTCLQLCPMCSQEWSKARNRLAEHLCLKLDDIKLSLLDPENEINKLLIPDKVSIASQTDVTGDEGAAAAAPALPVAKKFNIEHTGPYPCRVGGCSVNLFYTPLMQHLKTDHSTQFLEVQPLGDEKVFQHNWSFDFVEQMIFDRVVVVPDMGTFFLKLSTDIFGNFTGFLLVLHNGFIAKQFTYQLEISCCNEHKTSVKYTGEINSCRSPANVLREKCLNIKRTDIQRMLDHTKQLTCAVLLGKKPETDEPEAQSRPWVPKNKYSKNKYNAPKFPTQNRSNSPKPGPSNHQNRNRNRPQTAPNGNQGRQNQRDSSVQNRGGPISNMNRNTTTTGSIPSLLYPNLRNLS